MFEISFRNGSVKISCLYNKHLFDNVQQEYDLALWQCYGRYLKHFGDMDVEEITEVAMFKKVFFPSGFDGVNAGFTVSDSTKPHNCFLVLHVFCLKYDCQTTILRTILICTCSLER